MISVQRILSFSEIEYLWSRYWLFSNRMAAKTWELWIYVYSKMYLIVENIILAQIELDRIVALSPTWVETKQQIGRNWPWPLPTQFTAALKLWSMFQGIFGRKGQGTLVELTRESCDWLFCIFHSRKKLINLFFAEKYFNSSIIIVWIFDCFFSSS